MLKTSNMARKQAHIFSFRKYTFQHQGFLNFADVSIFLQKVSIFWQKQYLYSKQQCESCVRNFQFCFRFLQHKKLLFMRIWVPECSKLTINQKNDNEVTIFQHTIIFEFFDVILFLLSILVTCTSFMSISSVVLEL